MKSLDRERLNKSRPHRWRDDEETVGLAMVGGKLGKELVVGDTRGRCQLGLGANLSSDCSAIPVADAMP